MKKALVIFSALFLLTAFASVDADAQSKKQIRKQLKQKCTTS